MDYSLLVAIENRANATQIAQSFLSLPEELYDSYSSVSARKRHMIESDDGDTLLHVGIIDYL